jgi:hypothetical protein
MEMRSITVNLEYDERVMEDGREVRSKLEEQLYGTGFEVKSVTDQSSKGKDSFIKKDRDSTGAGGQTSPDNEKPPNEN